MILRVAWFNTNVLVLLATAVSVAVMPSTSSMIGCWASEIINSEVIDQDPTAPLPACHIHRAAQNSLWEISTRCLPRGLCMATGCGELPTCQYSECHWTASSESLLHQHFADHAAWTIVFVHGNRTSPEQARGHALSLFRNLELRAGNPVRLICLSWPSEKSRPLVMPTVLVEEKRELIRNTGFQLACFLNRLPQDSVRSMMGFSFGCSVIGCALHLLNGGEVGGIVLQQPNGKCFLEEVPVATHNTGCCHSIQLGFVAPAMDHCALQPTGEYGRAMESVGLLVNLYNSRDPVLRRFRFFDRQHPVAAGYSGLAGSTGLLMDVRSEPLARNVSIEQYDCRAIGSTHALSEFSRCTAYERLLENLLGSAH